MTSGECEAISFMHQYFGDLVLNRTYFLATQCYNTNNPPNCYKYLKVQRHKSGMIAIVLNRRSLAVVWRPDTTHTWPGAGHGLVVFLELFSAGIPQQLGLLKNLVW
jgi:hypothetical protein